ncbi:hypothetical protein Zmor_013725 [Zophobas morio]|uniref:Gustatory receptor n=1 Tax=Zophobas morio TaxID=2755281 RepID=A0AA38MFZ0_9CUCU|nr:hypothetical protein Zmor_013725 [Zophobas morio]
MWKKTRTKKRVTITPQEHNIHKSLRFIFVVAQIFGFFPVQGVLSKTPNSVGFSWMSVRILSAILTCTGGFLVALGHIRHMILIEYDQFEMNGVIFYTCGCLSCIYFIKMATEWPQIILKWQEVDIAMATYGWPRNLNRRIKIVSAVFLLLETAEHFSIQANKLIVAVQCKGSLAKGFEHFTVNMSFPVIFDVIKPFYSPWLGLVFQFVNTRMAFSWTFIDLFIILISCALAMRFGQINYRVRCLKNMKVQSERSWGSVNEDYNRMCQLCALLDDKMSFLILISFFNNFYFIIFQVFGSLNLHKATALEVIYYYISLGLLLLRIVSICLYGSWIYEESKKGVELISSISPEFYNREILRFMQSIKYQAAGLTGKKFFKISRQLVLKIASAVVTYELVVIQFSRNAETKDEPSKNSIC